MNESERKYHTKEEILRKAQDIIGIPIKDIDKTQRISTGKGAIGSVIEESWFEYSINSNSKPDFEEAGVELKVTPYIVGKKGIRAKERLVCNIINYMEEYKNTFKTSSFWKKCNTMLLMSYEHKNNIPKGDFTISKATLFSFPEKDLRIIEQDWKTIIDKIKSGKAHEISEGDTLYLGACTKGANSKSLRQQPFSSILAKQRAYSLKQSYMTYVLNAYIFGSEEDENIITNPEDLKEKTFEEYIIDKITHYIGCSEKELFEKFNVTKKSKNMFEMIVARILGVKGHLSSTEEFKKANIIPKTIRVQKNGKIKENMSFPKFDFIELSREEWETSTLKKYLEPTKFMFIVFQEKSNGEYYLDRLKFWNIPLSDLEEVHKVWQKTVDIINEGVVLTKTSRGVANNLPKKTENRVAHVRPHGKNGDDKNMLPDGRKMTKQCFWLNNTYLEEIISN